MRSGIVSSVLAVLAVATASPAQYARETYTQTGVQTIIPKGASAPTAAVDPNVFAAAADDDATTILTLDSAKTVLITVPGRDLTYTALPEQGNTEITIAYIVNVVVDYENPDSTVSTVTQTQTIRKSVDFCTQTTVLGTSS